MKPSSLSKVTKTSTKLAASVKNKLIYLLSFINEKQYVDTDSYIGRDKRDLHSSVLRQKNCKICDLRLPKSKFNGCGIIKIAKLSLISILIFEPLK